MSDEGTQTAGESQTGSSSASGQDAGSGERTFTQAELEKHIQQRVARAEAKYADYDDLRSKASRVDELEQAQQSEMDKLRTKAEREAQKRAESEDKAKQATERAETALKRAAVVAAAAQLNAADPSDVFTLLDKSTLSFDDEGNVQGAAEAVQDLLKSKPHLLKRSGGFDSGHQGGASGSQPSMNDLIRREAGFSAVQ